ncbi:uncharacterized protein VTP21DRAFT_8056 [Calcarisporiella thermophila]|uniref:uncharacterized protein n=1 Tax=Calcarisporiella thermophila TaxID=911321 RepID=UPI003742A5F0
MSNPSFNLLSFQPHLNQKPCRSRKACYYCRQKKLKCDGNISGCFRCKLHCIQCVYPKVQLPRGRSKARHFILSENGIAKMTPRELVRKKRIARMSEQVQMCAERLYPTFANVNIRTAHPTANLGWEIDWSRRMNSIQYPYPKIISNEMLGILVENLSALNVGETLEKKFPILFQYGEDANSLFTTMPLGHKDPLKSITYNQAVTLIDKWFQLTTFPNILSRAVMINNYQNQLVDPFLYSALFSSALMISGIPLFNQTRSGRPGSVFTEYALSLLNHITQSPSLTKLQGLFILGCDLARVGRSKSGIPLLATAWKMAVVMRIPEQDMEGFNEKLDPVERELRNNIWWAMRIAFTWSYFHIRSPVDKALVFSYVKMPVKTETESYLYELEMKHGYFTSLQDQAQAIRSFYNCAYLTEVLTEIWLQLPPTAGFQSLYNPDNEESAQNFLMSPPSQISFSPSKLATMINKIPEDLPPLNMAEILLFLSTLYIHARFPKAGDSPIVFIYSDAVIECVPSANIIVDLVELVINDPDSIALHSIAVFGLSTSACIQILLAESGICGQREHALRNMRRILSLLQNESLIYYDYMLIRNLENLIERSENCPAPTPVAEVPQCDPSTLIPVLIPRVSLEPLSAINVTDNFAFNMTSVLVMLIQSPKNSSSSTTRLTIISSTA